MPYGVSESVDCKECGSLFPHYKKLSEHIKKNHGLDPVGYYIKFFHNNVRPSCVICGSETRYVSLSEGFKKNCKDHAKLAMSLGGTMGGKAESWNKGKTKDCDDRLLEYSKRVSGVNNPFFGRRHSDETKNKNASAHRLQFSEVLTRLTALVPEIKVLSGWKDYETQDSLLRIVCGACDTEDKVSFFNLKRCWRCKKCNPLGSRQQREVSDYVKSLGFIVENSVRSVIPPLEIDVWIPEKNLGIEYHGLYWHSGGREDSFDKKKHRKKYEACSEKGIKLIQFFSDEWIEKEKICKSIIQNALGMNDKKLNARDCSIVELSVNTTKNFLENSHISGYTRCRHKFGLVHKEFGLVGIATTRMPIQNKWGKLLELARMSFLPGTSVRGGASKLLNLIKQKSIEEGLEGVLSYADLRFGNGSVYEKCGFKLVGESPINYWYTDGHKRLDRFTFRAQEGSSENDVAAREGVRAIWGSGNKVYVWKKDSLL